MSSMNLIFWSYNPCLPPTAFLNLFNKVNTQCAMRGQRWMRCSCSGEITSSRNHPPAPFFVTPLNFAPTAGHYHLAAKLLPRNPLSIFNSYTDCNESEETTGWYDSWARMMGSMYQLPTDPDFTRRQGTSSYDDGIVPWEGIKLWQMSA